MLETKVEAFFNRHSFQLDNKSMVVGVSGGPDSLALLYYLQGERKKRNLAIIAAHIDHMFRGQESYEDAMFVKEFCEQNDIPFEMTRVNVTALMESSGQGAEAAAREVRYQFYQQVMKKYDVPYLVLGHHGDDQIETILMRLTRGSTGKARAGILFSRPFYTGFIIRPFLCLTKNEIEEYCRRKNLSPRIDSTNQLEHYTRNRYRHQILPFLKKENPHVHEHFQRFSEELQSDEEYLQELAVKKMNTVVKTKEAGKITIDINRLIEVPLPLQRRGIQLILNYLYKEVPAALSAVHIDQLFHLIHHGGPSGRLDFPNGLNVYRSYQELSLQLRSSDLRETGSYHIEINEPGTVRLPNGASIVIEYVDNELPNRNSYQAVFPAKGVKWPLIIRSRKNGDRISLKGMQGSKKIKDIFIDEKVRHMERDSWPVITDGEGCILWLPGLKKSSLEGTRNFVDRFILLTYKK